MNKLIFIPVVLIVVAAGISRETVTLIDCRAKVDRYIQADFEEDYVCLHTDANGNVSTDVCTNYYSKQASKTNSVITINGEGSGPNFHDGYYYADMPNITTDYSNHYDFIGYREKHDVTIQYHYDDGDFKSRSEYMACLVTLGNQITFRTLYSIKLWEIS